MDPRAAQERFIEVHTAYRELLARGTGRSAIRNESPDAEVGPPPGPGEWDGRFAWELSAAHVRGLTDEALRVVIWYSLGWGSKRWSWDKEVRLPPRGSGGPALRRALLPLLDEAVRRELLTEAAEAGGDLEEAARLRAGRSRRHRARDAWLAAKSAGLEPAAVATLRERFEVLTEARADITADEGAYPADWDLSEADVAEIRRARALRRAGPGRPASDELLRGAGPGKRLAEVSAFFRVAARAAVGGQARREEASVAAP